MPWQIVNPVDGAPVGAVWLDDPADADNPGLLFDTLPDGAIWNGTTNAPRPRTDAEKLKAAKAKKIDEFAVRAIRDLEPYFTGTHGRDETLHILAGHVAQICQALGIPVDPRLAEVVRIGQKVYGKQAQVEGVTLTDATGNPRPVEAAIAEVEGMAW